MQAELSVDETGDSVETNDLAWKDIQSAVHAVLMTGGEQELIAQANAEKRLAGADVGGDRFSQSRFPKAGNGIAKGADPATVFTELRERKNSFKG